MTATETSDSRAEDGAPEEKLPGCQGILLHKYTTKVKIISAREREGDDIFS